MPDGFIPLPNAVGTPTALHLRLAALNRARLNPCLPAEESQPDPAALAAERAFLHAARQHVAPWAATAPTTPTAFAAWFANLEHTGPGQNHPLFPWLARHAPLSAMRWFLTQGVAREAGFEDLTALTQLRMPMRAKLELARNYWEDMVRGQQAGMHGPMLERLAGALTLTPTPQTTVWESLALANTMAGLAYHRHYAYESIGALGVIELTAPGRAAHVAAGLKRLGISAKASHYFTLHAVLDIKHAAAWTQEVILPLIAEDPARATAIAEGALMRLTCGATCFARYWQTLVEASLHTAAD